MPQGCYLLILCALSDTCLEHGEKIKQISLCLKYLLFLAKQLYGLS